MIFKSVFLMVGTSQKKAFNCFGTGHVLRPLISSAVASYLSFGTVVPGVSEFGMLVDVGKNTEGGHPYCMTSAYVPDPNEFSFTLRGAAGPCHMLDQIWFDSTRCQCQAVRLFLGPT